MSEHRQNSGKRRPDQEPRHKKHNTRVSIPIICVDCGKEEVLDYMPRGVSLTELKCSECMSQKVHPDSMWMRIERDKQEAARGTHPFTCAECGNIDYIRSEPDPDKDYYCGRCLNDHVQPGEDRGATENVGDTVKRRRNPSE